MEIKKVEITNFRNIQHAIYELGKTNCFVAKNHKGKSNTILAIYWLFTGKLLDGTSNEISLKPVNDTKAKVSVKITVIANDGIEHTMERTYQEKWTRTRGSDNLVLDGHETTFIVDDIVQKKTAAAQDEIDKITNITSEKFFLNKDVDRYQAVMNPFYLCEMADWKVLRKIIIGIVGDVTPDDVFNNDYKLIAIKDDLGRYAYSVDKLILFLNQQIANCKDSKIGLNAKIDLLEKTEDIPEEEIQRLEDRQYELKNALKNADTSINTNPLVKAKEEEMDALAKKQEEMYQKEYNEFFAKMEQERKDADAKYDDYIQEDEKFKLIKARIEELKSKVAEINFKIGCKDADIEKLKIERTRYLESYQTIKAEVMPAFEEITCPNCGHVLNLDSIEKQKKKWEEDHNKKLEQNITDGKATKLKMDSLDHEKGELKNSFVAFDEELKKVKNEANEKAVIVNEKKDAWMSAITHRISDFHPSEEYNKISFERHSAYEEYEEMKKKLMSDTSKDEIKAKITAEINSIKDRLGIHYKFLSAQDEIKSLNAELDRVSESQMSFELKKEYALEFNKTKLTLLDAKLTSHFGNEVKFVLVKTNITEGSWDNVCYPLIVGTDTPFKSGSRSEKVLTGIKVIELIKRELKINDMPIFIDEIGELDMESIEHLRTISNAQIIATRVDDDYNIPTLKSI